MKFLLINIFLMASLAFGQFDWPDNGAPIRQGLHIEWQRTGDANSDGSMIYAWSDCRNGIRDVIAQKIDVDGNNLWGENGVVVVNAGGRQEDPQLVSDNNGGAYIIWADYRDESDTYGDIYGQHVNSSGELSWGVEGIALANQPNKQGSLNICKDGIGGAYVIWKDKNASSYADIYGTHLTVAGPVGQGIGFPLVTHPSNRSYPSLESAGEGDAVLTWSLEVEEPDLYAQRIRFEDDVVTTLWSDPQEGGKLICNATYSQSSPRVYSFGEMETIITWEDKRNKDEYSDNETTEIADIYFQVFDEEGENLLEENGRSACSGAWDKLKPRIKAEDNTAFIVWEDYRNGEESSDIYAQKIDAEGIALWGNGHPVTLAENNQSQPRLTTDGLGGVYVVWEDHRNSYNTDIDIYVQHINSSDNFSFNENGYNLCEAPFMQFNPLVRNDGQGGSFIMWGDQRTGGSIGIYTQHITSSGASFEVGGISSFFGIATDAANDPYNHGILNFGDNKSIVYWQDNRWGKPGIFGLEMDNNFDYSSDYFSNQSINGDPLTFCPLILEHPKMIRVGDYLMLSFLAEESPNNNVYFQILDMELNLIGDITGTAISNPEYFKKSFDMVYGEDGFIYLTFSEDNGIFIQKLDVLGNIQWDAPLQIIESSGVDDLIKAIYPYPENGCLIVYESSSGALGSHLYGLAIDGDGQTRENWPSAGINLSSLPSDIKYDNSVITHNGVFTTFIENGSGSLNLFGQLISFEGLLLSGSEGIPIATGPYDEKYSDLEYNSNLNEVIACWQNPRISEVFEDTELDIHCAIVKLTEQLIGAIIELSNKDYDQMNPNILFTGESYLIAWEDYRNSTVTNPETDVFFQEINSDNLTFNYESGGISLCTAPLKQVNPRIAKYSDASDSFVIVWEDFRSTGKEFCSNLFGQSITYGEVSINPSSVLSKFGISKVYPNPFNPLVTIDFNVAYQSIVNVGIYNLRGQLVETLVSGDLNPGSHVLQWNAENFASGFYMVNYKTPSGTASEKIILIK